MHFRFIEIYIHNRDRFGGSDPPKGGVTFSKSDPILAFEEPFFAFRRFFAGAEGAGEKLALFSSGK